MNGQNGDGMMDMVVRGQAVAYHVFPSYHYDLESIDLFSSQQTLAPLMARCLHERKALFA